MVRLLLALLLVACPSADDDDVSGDDDDGTPSNEPLGDPVLALDILPALEEVTDVEIVGDLAFFCSNSAGFAIADISDPSSIELLIQSGDAQPRCDHLAVVDDLLYIAGHPAGPAPIAFFSVLDVSDPSSPQVRWTDFIQANLEGMAPIGDHLLVAAHQDGIITWRREGDSLSEVARFAGLQNPWQLRVRGDRAYVADGVGGLVTLDAGDPTALAELHRLELGGSAADLDLDGDRAAVALRGAGVALVDLSEPDAPVLLDLHDTPGTALAVAFSGDGRWLWVSDWRDVRLFDVSGDVLRFVAREPLPFEVVPLPVDDNLPNHTMGIAARDDFALSSGWTEASTFRLQPGVAAPDLLVEPRFVNLPRTPFGATSDAAVRLRNDGLKVLSVEGVSAEGTGFSVGDLELPLRLDPGQQQTVTLSFSAPNDAPAAGTLVLSSDDIDEPTQRISVEANRSGFGVGDVVDDFTFLDLDGGPVQLSALHDGPLLLAYFATF